MKNKILTIFLLLLVAIYYIERSFLKETSFLVNNTITIVDQDNNNLYLDMEEYLIGVVAGEMPASFEIEALKAQAIASRSYAYSKSLNNKILTTDNKTQVYLTDEELREKWKDEYNIYIKKIKTAVESTKNMVITYDGNVITAYYFSMSNGNTENALTVFNEDKSYLTSVESKEDINNKDYMVTTVFNTKKFCELLEISCEVIEIKNIIKNNTNHVNSITINNKTFTGIEIRKRLNLRSTDFEIRIKENIDITTYGHGHGVGMSQYGANIMAKNNSNYIEILKHYYNDIEINDIKSII